MPRKVQKKDLLYPELSYEVVGALFNVWEKLGWGYKEKFYQKATAQELENKNLSFKKENPARVTYGDRDMGKVFFDFLVEDKLILELKVRNYFSKQDIRQLYEYLKVADLQLGIIAHFTRGGVRFKRIINIDQS